MGRTILTATVIAFCLSTVCVYAQEEEAPGDAVDSGPTPMEVDTDLEPSEESPKIYRTAPIEQRGKPKRIKDPSVGGTEATHQFEEKEFIKSIYKSKGHQLDVDPD